MDRFKITCEISDKQVEIQFDMKKMPGEAGPCYMVSVDGLFQGYVKKQKGGRYILLQNSQLTEAYLSMINERLRMLEQQ